MIHAIGADFVIDYTEEDFLKSTQTYDVIFDIVGKSSFPSCIRLLNQNGCYLLANAGPLKMIRGKWTSISSSKKVITDPASHKIKDLIFLKELLETGKIKPVIDRLYSFEQIVEAHKYVETGHKKGNVVIIVEHN
jgi:NADPH:quinone reductase-like Zn-dependent oxidoreductase